jgi:hypothetical protein
LAIEPGGEVRRFRSEVQESLRSLVAQVVDQTETAVRCDVRGLALELEQVARELARGRPVRSTATPPSVLAARAAMRQDASWSTEETIESSRQGWSSTAPPAERAASNGTRVLAGDTVHRPPEELPGNQVAPRVRLPSRPISVPPGEIESPHWSFPGAEAYDVVRERSGFPLAAVLVLGSVLFLLFFLVGYFSAVGK